jgi:hypothetical protein
VRSKRIESVIEVAALMVAIVCERKLYNVMRRAGWQFRP